MALNDTGVKNLQFTCKHTQHTDGQALYLLLSAIGKYRRLDDTFAGKRKTLSLGHYPDASLAKARKRRDEARKLLADGFDPSAATKKARAEEKLKNWLKRDIYPVIGSNPIFLLDASSRPITKYSVSTRWHVA
jgi:hypothetical protein